MTHVRFALLMTLLIAACVPGAGQPTSQPALSPTMVRGPTADPTGLAGPTALASPTTAAAPTDDEPPLPPAARLTLPDGSSYSAALGSYSYGGAAADSPWLPARVLTPVDVEVGARIRLDVPEERFVRWSARYAAADDEAAEVITQLASGGDGVAPLAAAEFGAPPSGSWVLGVQVYFAADAGDAAYYWHLIVP